MILCQIKCMATASCLNLSRPDKELLIFVSNSLSLEVVLIYMRTFITWANQI